MTSHFDTLSAVEALESAGIASEHARAIVGQMNRAVDENVATKADVKLLGSDLNAKIAEVRGEFKTEIAAVKGELKEDIAAVKGELKEDIAAVRTEIAHSTNRAIYTLGGLVTVLFVLDRIIPLFGIPQ